MCTVGTVFNSGLHAMVCVNSEEYILPLCQHMLAVFNLLTISCKYSENGCEEKLKINQTYDCKKACKVAKVKKKRVPYQKVKLYDVVDQCHKRGRLRGMYPALSDVCHTNNENAEGVLFSILMTTLQDNGKAELAKKVNYLWTERVDNVLSVDESLTIRIDLLQTKNMYKKQSLFEQGSICVQASLFPQSN